MGLKRYISKNIVLLGKKYNFDLAYFVKNSFWMFFGHVLKIIMGVVLTVIFARFTSKEIFGEYSLLLSIMGVLSIITMPGFSLSMMKAVSKNFDGVYIKSIKCRLIWSSFGSIFLFFIVLYYLYNDNYYIAMSLLFSMLIFPFFYSTNSWISFLQGKKKFDLYSKFHVFQHFFSTLFTIITILFTSNVFFIFIIYILSNLIFNIIYSFRTKKYVKNNLLDKGWKSSGYKLTITNFISVSYEYLDKILIGILLGSASLAVYTIVVLIIYSTQRLFKELMKITMPKIFLFNKEKIYKLSHKMLYIVSFFSIIISIITYFLTPIVIHILYSAKYADAIKYVQLYTISFPLYMLMTLLTIFFISLNKEKELIYIKSISLVINVILYLVLIPQFGIIGAIISSLIFYLINIILLFYYFKK
jgi:O-antigen/teichoic acid export membrane protein